MIDQKDHYIAIAAYRMAPVDLPRIRKLVDVASEPFHQAHARGLMAVALAKADAKKNLPASRALVRAAFDGLDAAAAKKPSELPISAGNFGNIGGWLVLHAQRIGLEAAQQDFANAPGCRAALLKPLIRLAELLCRRAQQVQVDNELDILAQGQLALDDQHPANRQDQRRRQSHHQAWQRRDRA